ncbi:MAG: hypothetical protein ACLS3M_11265 [Collinsella sp.]
MLQQRHDVLAVDGLHRNLFCAQALADNGQIARLCLAHKQIEHVAVDQASRVALADCRPNYAHQLADRLHARYHAQEQKTPHLAICQRLFRRELLAKGSLLEHASAVNAAFILRHRLIVKGTAQRTFDQAAQDAEQVLIIEGHLVFGRTTHKDQHSGCPVALDRVSKHGKPGVSRGSPTGSNDPVASKEVQAAQARASVRHLRQSRDLRHQAQMPRPNMVDRHRIVLRISPKSSQHLR